MPLVIRSRVVKAVRRIGCLTFLGVLGASGAAFAACPSQSVNTPFAQWGDTANYFLVPGGAFEGTSDQVGWSLSNANLSAGNESFGVNGSGDQQSLTINAGGSATSPYFCVDNTMSNLRLFARQSAAGSDLKVEALVQTPSGVQAFAVGDLAAGPYASWSPTQPITGDTSTIANGGSLMVALKFDVPASSGPWQIDDVYVDPYRAG